MVSFFHVQFRKPFTDQSVVNELSNRMDLPSALQGAQALFRRFQRTVEAIDKKDNFPTPTIRQHKTADGKSSASPKPGKSSNATGADARRGSHARGSSSSGHVTPEMLKKRIISPELRALLNRKVEKLDKKEDDEHGSAVRVPTKQIIREV